MAIAMATGTGQAVAATVDWVPLQPTIVSYDYSKDEPGETIYTNIAGALDQPNTIRCAAAPIADIFRGAPVDPITDQTVDGLSILVQVNEAWKVNDSANTSFVPYYLPVSAHMVLKVPVNEYVTAAAVVGLITRLAGAPMRAAGDNMSVAISKLLRGVVRL